MYISLIFSLRQTVVIHTRIPGSMCRSFQPLKTLWAAWIWVSIVNAPIQWYLYKSEYWAIVADPNGYENYIYFLTTQFNKTTVYNYNMARSGASVSEKLSHNKNDDLLQQVQTWTDMIGGPYKMLRRGTPALASFWFGTNEWVSRYRL